jgi:hypothetical protein
MTKKHFQSPFKLDSSTSSTSTSKVNNKLNQERQDHEHSRLKSMSRLREAWADIQSRHDHYQLHNTTQQIAGKTRALREEEDDIIDLFSMTVVIDRGVLRNAKSGSWAIGSYALPGGPIRRSNQGWDHEQLDHHQDDHPDDDWEELSEDDDDPMGQWNEVMDAPSVISRLAKRKRAEELDDLRMFLQDEARHQALLSTASTSPIDSTRSITSPIPTPIPIPIRGSEVLTALNNLPTGTGNVILPMALTGSGTSRGNTPSSFGSRGSREKSRAEMELEREEDELSIIIPSMPVIPITMPSRKGKEKATPPTTTRVEKVAPKKIRSTSLPLTLPVHAPVASSSVSHFWLVAVYVKRKLMLKWTSAEINLSFNFRRPLFSPYQIIPSSSNDYDPFTPLAFTFTFTSANNITKAFVEAFSAISSSIIINASSNFSEAVKSG